MTPQPAALCRAPSGRLAVLVFCVLLLGACQLGFPGAGPRQAELFGGDVTAATAAGYCIDGSKSVETADSAVVMIGRCFYGARARPAVVTVTVGAPGSAAVLAAGPEALAAFFTSPEGRATLARSGLAEDVDVTTAVQSGEDFLILLTDGDSGPYWRAVTGLSGRLVTVSAMGTSRAPLDEDGSRAVLDAALAALRRANPAPLRVLPDAVQLNLPPRPRPTSAQSVAVAG